jgi:hypothetical protein
VTAAAQMQLSQAELELLALVADRKVFITKGRYRLLRQGTPEVGDEIHLLRTRLLVRLSRIDKGERVPPMRLVVLTEAGEQLWEHLGRP